MAGVRSYFSYSVIQAVPRTDGDANLVALAGVTWVVKKIDSAGTESTTTIYNGITGSTAIAGAGSTTTSNGLVEFWAEPGQYVVKISDSKNRISSKNIYWDSVSGQTGGIPADLLVSNSVTTTQIGDTQVKTADIDALSVTTAKLNNGAVTTAKIDDLAVTNDKIAVGAVAIQNLGNDVLNRMIPLGTVLDWYPPDGTSGPGWAVPSGFAICDGTAWNNIDNQMGANGVKLTSGSIPNLIGKYVIGADPTRAKSATASGVHNTTDGTYTSPGITASAGQNTVSNANHNHTIPNHFHEMSHWHDVSDHTHGISTKSGVYSRITTDYGETGGTQTLSLNTTGTGGASAHYTGGPLYRQWWDGATNGNARDNTAGWSGNTGGLSSGSFTYEDNRPLSIGLLKIMKVKNI